MLLTKNHDKAGGSSARLKYGHPPNEHDDFVDAYLVLTESLSHSPEKAKKERETIQPGTMGCCSGAVQGRS